MAVLFVPMPSLSGLNLNSALPVGAHYGVNSDAATSIGLIALSRLTRTKDTSLLTQMAKSSLGVALLTALRSLVLRVALATPGFDTNLSDANMISLFNLQGSSSKYESQYGNFGSLQSRLPWPTYKRLVAALLEALTTARMSQVGHVPGQLLLMATPTTPLDAAGQAAVDALAAAVEQSMLTRLTGDAAASSS